MIVSIAAPVAATYTMQLFLSFLRKVILNFCVFPNSVLLVYFLILFSYYCQKATNYTIMMVVREFAFKIPWE